MRHIRAWGAWLALAVLGAMGGLCPAEGQPSWSRDIPILSSQAPGDSLFLSGPQSGMRDREGNYHLAITRTYRTPDSSEVVYIRLDVLS